jgi:hypothetical protein
VISWGRALPLGIQGRLAALDKLTILFISGCPDSSRDCITYSTSGCSFPIIIGTKVEVAGPDEAKLVGMQTGYASSAFESRHPLHFEGA